MKLFFCGKNQNGGGRFGKRKNRGSGRRGQTAGCAEGVPQLVAWLLVLLAFCCCFAKCGQPAATGTTTSSGAVFNAAASHTGQPAGTATAPANPAEPFGSSTAGKSSKAQSPAKGPAQPPAAQPGNTERVWIPRSGSKYHRSPTCSNMKNPTQVSKSKALSLGYTPCQTAIK